MYNVWQRDDDVDDDSAEIEVVVYHSAADVRTQYDGLLPGK